MKPSMFIILVLSVAVGIVQGSNLSASKLTSRLPAAQVTEIQKKISSVGGCNANICFAIDGSSRIPAAAFVNQKNFILDVISVIGVDSPAEFAAVQYSTFRDLITPLTGDRAKISLAVQRETQRQGLSATAEGIVLCSHEVHKRPGEAMKIVLLTDGVTSAGRNALWRAEVFRWRRGAISVVAAGEVRDPRMLWALAGFRKDRVFRVTSFLDVLQLQAVVQKVVYDVCEVNGGKYRRPGHWRGFRKWGTAR